MLIDRLVFGCARLNSGSSGARGGALIDLCLAKGVRNFDTAPPYALGEAERLVGAATQGMRDVRITAKVGLPHPRAARPMALLQRLKRRTLGSRPRSDGDFGPWTPPPANPNGRYAIDEIEASLERTSKALRRDTVDWLLVHEAGRDDLTGDVMQFLEAALARRSARIVGYAHGGGFDAGLDDAVPPGFAAQLACPPELFTVGALQQPPREHVALHSIIKVGRYLQRTDPNFARRVQAAARANLPMFAPETAEIGTLFAVLSERCARARLVFATSEPDRLYDMLDMVRHIDEEIRAAAITQTLDAEMPAI